MEVAFGLGMAGTALFLAGMLRALRHRRWQWIALALLMIIPPLIMGMTIVQPARRWFSAIYAAVLATAILWSAAPLLVPRRRWWLAGYGVAAIAINLYALPTLGHVLRRSGVPVDNHTLLYRATADVLAHHRINQRYLARAYGHMRNIRDNAPEGSLLVGHFACRYFLMATYCQDDIAASARIIHRSDGNFISRVDSQNHFYCAEVYPAFDTRDIDITPPAIYHFGGWMPESWQHAEGPIHDLTPPHHDRYAMWLRGP